MVIYRATLPNGKSYIGCSSRSLNERQRGHKCSALTRKSKLPFHRAIRKYGFENINWEIIYETDSHSKLLSKEIELISKLNTVVPNGYNITLGGEGSLGSTHCRGLKKSIEAINNMREASRSQMKPCVLVNCTDKTVKTYESISSLSKDNNLPYVAMKTILKKKQCYYNYKVLSLKEFDENNPKLFTITCDPKSKKFEITNGVEVIKMESINHLRRFLNISERVARNIFYKNKIINGWSMYGGA